MTRKQNQMVNASDKASSQAVGLSEAADLLQSNAFCMGDHHLTLVAFAETLPALSEVVSSVASESLANTINIQPTLRKNQGELVSIFVARDLDFSTVYQVSTTASVPYDLTSATR